MLLDNLDQENEETGQGGQADDNKHHQPQIPVAFSARAEGRDAVEKSRIDHRPAHIHHHLRHRGRGCPGTLLGIVVKHEFTRADLDHVFGLELDFVRDPFKVQKGSVGGIEVMQNIAFSPLGHIAMLGRDGLIRKHQVVDLIPANGHPILADLELLTLDRS